MPRQRSVQKKKKSKPRTPYERKPDEPDIPLTPELRLTRACLSKRGISKDRCKQWSTQELLRATEGDSQDSWKGCLKPFIGAMFGTGKIEAVEPKLPPMPVVPNPRFVPAEVPYLSNETIPTCEFCLKHRKSLTCLAISICCADPF